MASNRYVPRKISEVSEKDIYICLVGRVSFVGETSFVLKDKTGELEILSDQIPGENKLVRAFCSREDSSCKAHIIQNLENVDEEIFEKAEEAFRAINQ